MNSKILSVNNTEKLKAVNKKYSSKNNVLKEKGNSQNLKTKGNISKQKQHSPSSKAIIVWSDFNTLPFSNKRLTKSWIEKRIDIFMKFTLQSLKAQTNQNFLALIKYEDKTNDIITNILDKYPMLPSNINFISKSKYENKVIQTIKGFKYLYLVRLDSDDMYHKSFIQQLYDFNHHISTEAIINQNGYIYDSIQNLLAKFPQKSPNYYTLVYKVTDYIYGKRYKIPGGHPNVIKLLKYETIKKPNYIRLVHSENDSSTFRLANKKNIIADNKKVKKTLKNFM